MTSNAHAAEDESLRRTASLVETCSTLDRGGSGMEEGAELQTQTMGTAPEEHPSKVAAETAPTQTTAAGRTTAATAASPLGESGYMRVQRQESQEMRSESDGDSQIQRPTADHSRTCCQSHSSRAVLRGAESVTTSMGGVDMTPPPFILTRMRSAIKLLDAHN